MIKASALLVVLAIGLLVAGVVGSSLLMVYVSIGVCTVAAVLLAVGVLSHWSEIFGRREARPASTQGAWSEPQVHVTGPVLASIQAQAVAAARGSGRPGREEAGVQPDGARPGGPRPGAARPADGRAPERPDEVVPSPAEAAGRGDEFPAPGRSDDLWERVEEELGSAAKRDTGALSWPGTVFPPVPPDGPVPGESAPLGRQAGPPGEPRVGAGAWIWGSGAGWQPPETADPAWPPPAAAFAEPQAAPEPAAPEPDSSESATADPAAAADPAVAAEPAAKPAAAGSDGPGETAGPPVPGETAAEPASDAEVAPDTDVAEGTEAAPDDEAGQDANVAEDVGAVPDDDGAPGDGVVPDAEESPAAEDHKAAGPTVEGTPGKPATGNDGPRWIIAASRPAGQEPAAGTPAAESPADQKGTAQETTAEAAVEEPAAGDSAVKESTVNDPGAAAPGGGGSAAQESAAPEPAAREPAAQVPAAGAPGPPEPAAEEPASDGATAKPAPGRVEVTVVPGVARYHRSGCILIRFLGAGDLEIMTRQEAEDAKFAACRACQPDQLED